MKGKKSTNTKTKITNKISDDGYKYRIIRSSRKSSVIKINRDGSFDIKVPNRTTDKEVKRYISNNHEWIVENVSRIQAETNKLLEDGLLTNEDIRMLADKALEIIPKKVEYYARILGVTYNKICIRNQRTRWGSCSAKKNLNFNCLLMLMPDEVIDSVVVHELCHLKEMNHSENFYKEVLRVYPDYYRCNNWLKENGRIILRRMTG